MNTLLNITEKYIEYCKTQKCLNSKTLKAYCTDLNQFIDFLNNPYIHGYHYYAHCIIFPNSSFAPSIFIKYLSHLR